MFFFNSFIETIQQPVCHTFSLNNCQTKMGNVLDVDFDNEDDTKKLDSTINVDNTFAIPKQKNLNQIPNPNNKFTKIKGNLILNDNIKSIDDKKEDETKGIYIYIHI